MSIRYQGGDCAGHTIVIDGKKFRNLHLIPSLEFSFYEKSLLWEWDGRESKSLVKGLT